MSSQGTDLFRRIAQTKDPINTKKLKKVLIIRGKEPDHFFTCICEKFNGFVKNPEVFEWKRFHFDYDFVVFPLYAGCFISAPLAPIFSEIMNIMKELISSKRVAALFLRGSNEYSVPSRLGYVYTDIQKGFVDFTCETVDINVEVLNETCMKSDILLEFKAKHPDLFIQNEKHKKVALANTYLSGLSITSCTDISNWHILAQAEEGKKLCMLIHKTERVMFTPWYGFSHGNQLSHDLVRYFCKYLVLEYLREESSTFKTKLCQKYQNYQLCDISVMAFTEE
ncbi:hypothetical protein C9374_000301 [Naegleria lovaniensis]|uniref:Uncharacterized protein n=1 Tax=Naegleria lovaniensis TaxID=51637 RepID=A0AA88GXG2_NAELO|nr:uncharacterized protein C9374_000301 [Naegleria lovaniensis]KAG2388862.1 hypothetical protein C9374_000301 [Naegleria lovaniensis]